MTIIQNRPPMMLRTTATVMGDPTPGAGQQAAVEPDGAVLLEQHCRTQKIGSEKKRNALEGDGEVEAVVSGAAR